MNSEQFIKDKRLIRIGFAKVAYAALFG